jgi:hypothetical protein
MPSPPASQNVFNSALVFNQNLTQPSLQLVKESALDKYLQELQNENSGNFVCHIFFSLIYEYFQHRRANRILAPTPAPVDRRFRIIYDEFLTRRTTIFEYDPMTINCYLVNFLIPFDADE